MKLGGESQLHRTSFRQYYVLSCFITSHTFCTGINGAKGATMQDAWNYSQRVFVCCCQDLNVAVTKPCGYTADELRSGPP